MNGFSCVFGNSGQVSVEYMIAIFVLLVFFSVFLAFIADKNTVIPIIDSSVEKFTDCEKIASIVSGISFSGNDSSIILFNDKNVFFQKNFINLNDGNTSVISGVSCRHFARLSVENFSINGNMKISNANGKVVVEQL